MLSECCRRWTVAVAAGFGRAGSGPLSVNWDIRCMDCFLIPRPRVLDDTVSIWRRDRSGVRLGQRIGEHFCRTESVSSGRITSTSMVGTIYRAGEVMISSAPFLYPNQAGSKFDLTIMFIGTAARTGPSQADGYAVAGGAASSAPWTLPLRPRPCRCPPNFGSTIWTAQSRALQAHGSKRRPTSQTSPDDSPVILMSEVSG